MTTINEFRAAAAEQQRIAREILSRANGADLVGADADAFDAAIAARDEANAEADKIERRAAAIREMAGRAGHVESGATHGGSAGLPRTVRDDARHTIETRHSAGELDDRQALLVERLTSDPVAARWVNVTGSDEYREAFAKKLIHGDNARDYWTDQERDAFRQAHELRAMAVGGSGSAEMLLPFTLDPAIILTSAGTQSAIAQLASTVTIANQTWHGTTSAGVTSSWDDEAEQVSDDSPTLARVSIDVHRLATFVPFSIESEDATNLVAELGKLIADDRAVKEALAFTTGSGVGEPQGLITGLVAASTPIITGNGSEAYAASDLAKLQNALAARWQPNAAFLMALATRNLFADIETTSGAVKFPGLSQVPANVLGRRVYEESNMDAVLNPAATENNYSVCYGDIAAAYKIVRHAFSTVELVPHLMGANGRPTGQRGLYAFGRVGGEVVNPAAAKVLNVATTA